MASDAEVSPAAYAELQDVHEYCLLLLDVVRNYAFRRRDPSYQAVIDWGRHRDLRCPAPSGFTDAVLEEFHSPDHSKEIGSKFPGVVVSSVHQFVSKYLEGEMLGANGIEELTSFVGKLDRLNLKNRLAAEFSDTADPWQGLKTSAEYANQLGINTKTIQRALPDLIKRGLASRKSARGKINLRQSAIQELKPGE